MAAKQLEFVTIGETMLRLMAPEGTSLEAASQFQVGVAGAESNVAVALARLGHRTGWISRLPETPLGRLVAKRIAEHGVDISRVLWADPSERLGTYYWEPEASPRPGRILYDRRHSAFSRIDITAVDWEYVAGAGRLHLTGITPALGSQAQRLVEKALVVARSAGAQVSFDVNYRANLWHPADAGHILRRLAHGVDLLFCASRDARLLFEADGHQNDQARELARDLDVGVCVITCGADGAVAWDGSLHSVPALPVTVVDPIGRGDAFAAGFLHKMPAGTLEALRYGSALAALKQTYRGDFVWTSACDLDSLVNQSRTEILR